MFKKMQRQLTLVAVVGSGLILLLLMSLSLHYTSQRLEEQMDERFRSAVRSVATHFDKRTYIDTSWILKTEAQHQVYLSIEMAGHPISFTAMTPQRELFMAETKTIGTREHGFSFSEPPASLLAETSFFHVTSPSSARAALIKIPWEKEWIVVTVVKDKAPEQQQLTATSFRFALLSVIALGLLGTFFWFFSRRVIRPIKENHQRQVDFVSSASHELRSPLAAIQSTAGAIKQAPVLAEAKAFATSIEEECQRLGRLVRDLLLLASIDSQAVPVAPSYWEPETLLLNASERIRPAAQQKEIQLHYHFPDTLSRPVYSDLERMEQLVGILLENAVSYTPQGGTIALSVRQKGNLTVLTVEDSGPGIPKEERDKVFERFYQIDRSRTQKNNYGIGLSLARELAALLSVTISIEDSALGGACFSLQFKEN